MTHEGYSLIDSGLGRKLEQVGPYRIVRPCMQALWQPLLHSREWESADAVLTRKIGGEGVWTMRKDLPQSWTISVPFGRMVIRRSDFGHLGIFPEQQNNWITLSALTKLAVKRHKKNVSVLNLFAYTGGSTFACAKSSASVTHVDASKPTVTWARENAIASRLENASIRWIVDDALKFCAREVRRGSKYHGIILDPPSFGRGAAGEMWKIEEHLPQLLALITSLLADDAEFLLLSAHSDGCSALVLENLVRETVAGREGQFIAHEMVIRDSSGGVLPSGASCLYHRLSQ